MSVPMAIITWLIILITLNSRLVSAAVFASPPDHSQWHNTASRLSCTLSHVIPRFGQATFLEEAGEAPKLRLDTIRSRHGGGKAQLYGVPAAWGKDSHRQQLAEVVVTSGNAPLEISDPLVYHALSQLQAGRQLGIALPKEDPSEEPVILRISNVGFLSAYEEYQRCLGQLVPVSFKQLATSELYFETNTMRLSPEAVALLEYVLIYDELAGPIRKIVIEGHSDSVGRFVSNTKLSLQRAWAVKDWLVFSGISAEVIQVKGLGSSRPIASNKTPAGRAKNRRATLRLSR